MHALSTGCVPITTGGESVDLARDRESLPILATRGDSVVWAQGARPFTSRFRKKWQLAFRSWACSHRAKRRHAAMQGEPRGFDRKADRTSAAMCAPLTARVRRARAGFDFVKARSAKRTEAARLNPFGRNQLRTAELVRPRGFEPLTFGSGGQRSIQLSYGRLRVGATAVQENWCARRDSNSRPPGSKPDALSN